MTNVSSPLPTGPWTPGRVRMLKIAVAILTALLILGILALVYGVARQASKLGTTAKPLVAALPAQPSAPQPPYLQSLPLGQGELKSVSVTNGMIVLHWKGNASDTVLTVDAQSGRELGRIQVPHQ